MRARAVLVATGLMLAAPIADAVERPDPLGGTFPRHWVALGLGLGQMSQGLVARVYLSEIVFAQAAGATVDSDGTRTTTGVFALGVRGHSTERTGLLVRAGLACHLSTDVDPSDGKAQTGPSGCLNFVGGFGAEVRIWWKLSMLLGASMSYSSDDSRWQLLPEIELTVHLG